MWKALAVLFLVVAYIAAIGIIWLMMIAAADYFLDLLRTLR